MQIKTSAQIPLAASVGKRTSPSPITFLSELSWETFLLRRRQAKAQRRMLSNTLDSASELEK